VRRSGGTDPAGGIAYGDRASRPTGTATPNPSDTARGFDDALVPVGDLGTEPGGETEVVGHGYSFVVHPAGLAVTGTTMRLSAPLRHWYNKQSWTGSAGEPN
jgi:hypothetical protein